jgi:hypothetical protein
MMADRVSGGLSLLRVDLKSFDGSQLLGGPGHVMMLVTLSVRRAQPPGDAAGSTPAGSSAVFFVKVGPKHTIRTVQETLAQMLGLAPEAALELFFNGSKLSPDARPAGVCARPCARAPSHDYRGHRGTRRTTRGSLTAPPSTLPSHFAPQAGLHTGAVIDTALDDASFESCMRSEHKGLLVDLDDFSLSRTMGDAGL